VSPTAAPILPSGTQHELRRGDQHAVVVEVGGGLRTYASGEGEVLDGYQRDQRCSGGRGQPLIPWPNRVRDGRYEFDGRLQQLALTEPEKGNAIHGLVRWANWSLADRGSDRVAMEHVLHPQPGWPGVLQLRIEYELGEGGLTVTTTAANVGAVACPFGAGFHPYLTLGTATVDTLILQAPGASYLEADERGIPTVSLAVAGTPFDFRSPRELGPMGLDHCFGDLERDHDGVAWVRIGTAAGGRRAALWLDSAYSHLMLFTGDTLAAAERRRGLAIEPMSCAPNALQTGEGVLRLIPGQMFTGRWGIVPAD
jgi:aldose 1-epimerase